MLQGAVDVREIKEVPPGKNSRDFSKWPEEANNAKANRCFVVFYGSDFNLKVTYIPFHVFRFIFLLKFRVYIILWTVIFSCIELVSCGFFCWRTRSLDQRTEVFDRGCSSGIVQVKWYSENVKFIFRTQWFFGNQLIKTNSTWHSIDF